MGGPFESDRSGRRNRLEDLGFVLEGLEQGLGLGGGLARQETAGGTLRRQGEGTFRAEREIEGGTELVEGALPAVITAQKGLNEPRYASLKGIMAAKKKTIEELDATSAPAVAVVSALALPPERPAGRNLEGEPAAQAQALLQALKDEAKVF